MQNQSKKIGLLVVIIIVLIVIYLWLVNLTPNSQIIELEKEQTSDFNPQEIEDLKNKIDELDIDFEDILRELDIQ